MRKWFSIKTIFLIILMIIVGIGVFGIAEYKNSHKPLYQDGEKWVCSNPEMELTSRYLEGSSISELSGWAKFGDKKYKVELGYRPGSAGLSLAEPDENGGHLCLFWGSYRLSHNKCVIKNVDFTFNNYHFGEDDIVFYISSE